MCKFRKMLSLGLVLTLCMTMMLPVMARGGTCDHCGSTNIENIGEETSAAQIVEKCIHGYANSNDTVDYLLHYDKVFCSGCGKYTLLRPRYEEMRRICQWARSCP